MPPASSLPSSLNAWLPLAAKYGVGSLIALYLVWQLSDGIRDDIKQTDRNIAAVAVKVDALGVAMERAMEREFEARRQADFSHLMFLRAICFNTAQQFPAAEALCRAADPGARR